MTPTALQHAPVYAAAAVAAAAAGVLLAWWLRRHTTISIRNVYLAAALALTLDAAALYARAKVVLPAMVPVTSCAIAAAAVGRRWRLSDLGAGEELRTHERARRWLWQPAPTRAAGERVYLTTQGQLVRERQWPVSETYVPLTTDDAGPRVPRRSGRHVFVVGATGSGKTTSALRAAAGRTVKDHAALFFVDQKGDPDAEEFLRRLAAATGRPFILIDPRAADTDHWQPLWGERPAEVVARVLAGIETSEPYYADTLTPARRDRRERPARRGLLAALVSRCLIEASQLGQFDRVVALAREHQATHPHLWRRVGHQAKFVASPEGEKALGGGLVRLDLVMGEAWRSVLEPRTDAAGDEVGVHLAGAIRERAIVLWRTHVDQMPDEAQTITAVILNDIQACAVEAQRDGPALWTCVLDEFGAVIATAASQALALLQRARTHEGQVHVITQSLADIEALTGQVGLLASMADNFAAFIVHRQTVARVPRLGGEADGHQRALAVDRPDQRLRRDRRRQPPPRPRVPRQLRRVRRARASARPSCTPRSARHPRSVRSRRSRCPPATALIRIGDARGRCEMAVHPATQLPPAAKKTKTKTAAARTADATTSAPRARRARADAAAPRDRPVTPAPAPTDRQDRADDV